MNMLEMIITIAGDLGAGKSTVAKILSKELGYKHYSSGDFMRAMADERGVSLMELSHQAVKDPSIDREIDDRQIQLGKSEDNFIIDGRISFHFIPQSYKIYLKVSPDEGGRRIYGAKRSGEKENTDLVSTIENLRARAGLERERYKKFYGIDPGLESHYDIIIDTTKINAEQVARKILKSISQRNKSK